ncbi:MAG: hypothetical protein SF029_07885 [bacterium]|nr:hypothetical protein [bacterium]
MTSSETTNILNLWNVAQTHDDARNVVVFSGGACNVLSRDGQLLRNSERDHINAWLTRNNILFFDPQIHPDTHGCEYDYDIHHHLEVTAREASQLNLLEVSPRTFGGVTSLEIAVEEFRMDKPTVIFFSDGNNDRDLMPAHSRDGYPLFMPQINRENETSLMAHYTELIKNANRMRQYLMLFAEKLGALTVTFTESTYEGDIVITPYRMHAADLFHAVVRAAAGKRANVNFTGGDHARDSKGNPLFLAPKKPREVELRAFIDQYIDEGNALRRAICQLVHINVFVRVVFTQDAAVTALTGLLKYKGHDVH